MLRRQLLISALAGSGFVATSNARSSAPGDATLKTIAERYFQEGLDLNPLGASFLLGEARFESQLAIGIAPDALHRDKVLQQRVLAQTERLDESALTDSDLLSLKLLRQMANNRLESQRYPGHLLPIDQYGGIPVTLAQLATGQSAQDFKTLQNYQNFLTRLKRLPAWNAQAIANMRVGIKQGIVQPKAIIERAIETLKPLTTTDLATHAFLQPLKNFPAQFTSQQKRKLRSDYTAALKTTLQPSLAALVHFLRQEYLPKGRSTAGINALPNGEAWYRYCVRVHTTTTMHPDEIHTLGLKEVARIHGEMEVIKKHFGYSGTLSAFLQAYAMRPEVRPFKTEKEVLDAYKALNSRISQELPRLFTRTPKATLEIRPEPELTKATASAHYDSPTPDGARPGIFFAVIMDPREYETTEMTSLFLHEGQPGHHFHLAGQQELPLPNFRKYDWITAYGEGWALYAETLGHQLGLYKDPDALLGHLKMELHRAIRLVTDTGLHAKGWTREATIQYMMDAEGSTESDARRATERYMADPGQALAYKIGALKIRELRDRAQNALGTKFSYPTFHDQILSDGALPLDLLEKKIDGWISRQLQ